MVNMTINGTNLSDFKGKLVERNCTLGEFDNKNTWEGNLLFPVFQNPKELYLKYNHLTLVIDINCANDKEALLKKNSLFNALLKSKIVFSDIPSLTFECGLSQIFSEEKVMEGFFTLTIDLDCYISGSTQTVTIENSVGGSVDNLGSFTIPCIVKITPIAGIAELSITGLTDTPFKLKNLTTNVPVVIDSIKGTVKEDQTNKFKDVYDMWEFPRLKPGVNAVSLNDANMKVEIKFNPRY